MPPKGEPTFDPDVGFRALVEKAVDFIVIGGIARVFHGSAYPTLDADIVVRRDRDNLRKLSVALNSIGAQLLAGSETLPVTPDLDRLWMGMNFSWGAQAGQGDTFVGWEGG